MFPSEVEKNHMKKQKLKNVCMEGKKKSNTHTQRGKDKKNSNETPDFSKRQLQLTEKHSQF